MIGRRKADKVLFLAAAWVILLWFTKMAVDYGILVPIAKVSVTEKIEIIFILPTLIVLVTIGISHFLKGRGE